MFDLSLMVNLCYLINLFVLPSMVCQSSPNDELYGMEAIQALVILVKEIQQVWDSQIWDYVRSNIKTYYNPDDKWDVPIHIP